MDVITLRTLESARRFPQELSEEVPRLRRGESHACQADGSPLRPVLITTFGEAGDPAVWRAYPLAVDAWLCAAGAHVEYAFLAPEEATALLDAGAGAARVGDHDLAEVSFRRVVSSWPGYAPGRVNLGSLYLDRVKAAQARSASPEEVRRLLDVAADQLEHSLTCSPPAPPEVRVMLGRIYVRSDRVGKGRALLESMLADPALGPALKGQAQALLDEAAAPPMRPSPAPIANVSPPVRPSPAPAPVVNASPSGPFVPYLVTDDHVRRRDALLAQAGREPEGAGGLLALTPDVHLTVAVDSAEGVSPLFAADLAERGLSLIDALAAARTALGARLGGDELPCRTYVTTPWASPPIWREGVHAVVRGTATKKVLVVGPSWMAASAATSGELFRRASRELGTVALRMVIPHRDRAFVFEDSEDEAQNVAFAEGIARAEADGSKPVSAKMFGLDAGGVTPAGRRALQWTLLSARRGASRSEIEAELPVDGTWAWAEGKPGRPDRLSGEHWRAPPFSLAFEFAEGALRTVRIFAFVVGDYAAFEELDEKLRKSLPDVDLRTSGGQPWGALQARATIENKGSAQLKVATPVQARVVGFGDMFGHAFGCKVGGEQAYGFDLGYQPGRRFLEM